MSISFTALSLLCLGRVLGQPACPSLNTDPNNAGKCGPKHGRCNPYLEEYEETHDYYALYCELYPDEKEGWCGSTAYFKNTDNIDFYDYRPSMCALSADQCQADLNECYIRTSAGLCECLGGNSNVDVVVKEADGTLWFKKGFCVGDDGSSFEALAKAEMEGVGDPACLAAFNAIDCMKGLCACDVNRIDVTEEDCERLEAGQWSAHSVSGSALLGPANVLPAPVDVAPTSSVPASMYALGGLITALLACIAILLCFAICIRPLVSSMQVAQTKTGYGAVIEDEDAAL